MCQHLVTDAFSVAGVTQLRLFRPRSFETDIPSTRTRFFMKKDVFSSAALVSPVWISATTSADSASHQ